MKNFPRFALCGLLLLAPATLTLSGCGGGSDKPAIPVVSRTDNFTLSNGQNASLVTRTAGRDVTGMLQILSEPTRESAELPVGLPLGNYNFVGTFEAPRGFNVLGTFPNGRDQFQATGQLPLPNAEGSYAISVNGTTVRGAIPAVQAKSELSG